MLIHLAVRYDLDKEEAVEVGKTDKGTYGPASSVSIPKCVKKGMREASNNSGQTATLQALFTLSPFVDLLLKFLPSGKIDSPEIV